MRKWIMALAAVCGIAGMMQAQEKYQYNEFYYQRSSLFELLPVGSDDIVFFGNSITNGYELVLFAPLGKSVLALMSCSADTNAKTLNLSKQEYCKVWGEAL